MAPSSNRVEPIDIIQKRFPKARREGYEKTQVDSFMEAVRESLEEFKLEAQNLRQQLVQRDKEIEGLRSKEATINATLVMAREVTENLKRNARAEADIVIGESRLEAERILSAVYDERRELQADIIRMRSTRARLLGDMRAMLETYNRVIDEIEFQAPAAR